VIERTTVSKGKTEVGAYFVSNYPPYSFWTPQQVGQAAAALDRPPTDNCPLGLYLHIPFCRKRCRFCYFKVYTDKDSTEINRYIDGLIAELTLYARKAVVAGRKPKFVYFGGGTPSYISTQQLRRLVDGVRPLLPWDEAQEITFECEPGTVSKAKLEILREIGVTRLSLGVENFSDQILELNGRAHNAGDIDKVYKLAREVGFPQINIDLIAGMVGETDENWRECVSKAIALNPDSVTLYQMELPPNTVISKEMRADGVESAPVADWPVKRAWAKYAFSEFEKAGYALTSGYTAVKDPKTATFLYRDLLWAGADLLALGVASFSHVQGVHFQNQSRIEEYEAALAKGELPLSRALKTTEEERMIREFILQMKKGRVNTRYFEQKYRVALQERFASQLKELARGGFLTTDAESVRLTRDGLLRVDELLHRFFLPEHRVADAA
jgi:oxygen-independent coproporphyrinogen-3 oxidase